jgi:hypothetical protein
MRESPCSNKLINRLTYPVKISPYFIIRNAYDIQPEIIQIFCSDFIGSITYIFKMLGTIQFNNQFGLMALKINNIVANDFLPVELHRINFQKIVPKMTFFFGHVPA